MHAISQLQRDIRFQELVLPGHATHSPSIVSCPDSCPTQSPHLPLTAPHSHGAQHLICPSMPTHHSQRNSCTASEKSTKWQAHPKTTARQQLHQHAVTQSSSAYLPFASSPTTATKLVLLNDASSLSSSSAQTLVLSPTTSFSHHPSQHQQNNALVPVPVSYYILDTLAPTPSQSQPSLPCVISTQTGGNTQQQFYNYSNSSVIVANNSQPQPHQRYCYQQGRQYSPVQYQQTSPGFKQSVYQPSQKSQVVPLVFQPPPRERVKSPAPQVQDSGSRDCDRQASQLQISQGDLSKFQISTRSPRYQSLETRMAGNSSGSDSTVNNSTKKPLPVVITSAMSSTLPNNGDVITSIQSTWLAAQPLGNVHLVMGLSTGLKNNATSSTQEQHHQPQDETVKLPSPIARPTFTATSSNRLEMRIEDDKVVENKTLTQNLLSDSSTSFDYTIEAEKMVSALCSSTPLKDVEDALDLNEGYCSADKTTNSKSGNSKFDVENPKKSMEGCDYELTNHCKTIAEIGATENSNCESVAPVIYFPCSNKPLGIGMTPVGRSISNTDLSQFKSTQSNINYRASSRSSIKDVGMLADKLCCKTPTDIPTLIPKDFAREKSTVYCQTDPLEDVNKVRSDSFREALIRGCDEISLMLRNQLPSPTLNVIINFCIAVKTCGVEKLTDNCTQEKEFLKKLILSFLRVASCWLYFNSENGGHNITDLMTPDLHEWFKQWQSDSVHLMECILKSVTSTFTNTDVGNNFSDWSQPDVHQLLPTQNPSDAREHLEATFSSYRQTYATSTTLTEDIRNSNQILSGPLLHNAIPNYLSSSCNVYGQRSNNETPEPLKYGVSNTQTNARHWRQRRFSDNQTDNIMTRGMRKQKSTYVNQKDVNRPKWNTMETVLSFPVCGDQKFGNESIRNMSQKEMGSGTSRPIHGDHPSGPERYSRQNTGSRLRQKSSNSGKRGTSIETNVRNKVTDNLDGLSKQWQIYRKNSTNEFQIISQPSTSGQTYHDKAPSEPSNTDIPKAKMTPLSQIEKRCHSADNSQQVDISAWFKNIAPSLTPMDPLPLMSIHSAPEITNQVTYANVGLPYQQSSEQQSPDISTTSTFVPHHRGTFSYQDSRNHIGNKKSHHNRNSTYVIKSPSPNLPNSHFLNLEEPDSSDDTQDRVYMKPGSYDVPKKTSSVNTRSCVPLHVNTMKAASPNKTNLAFPAAPLVPPPTRRPIERSSKLLWNTHTLKTNQESLTSSDSHFNGSSDTSDRVWKAACMSAESLLGSLQIQKRNEDGNKKKSASDHETTEVKELINGIKFNCDRDCKGTAAGIEVDGTILEIEENETKNVAAVEKRKFNVEKTDHWLIRTFKLNVTNDDGKEKSDNESSSTGNSTLSTPTSTTTTNESLPQQALLNMESERNNATEKPSKTVMADKKKSNVANGIGRVNTSKNNCGKKGVGKEGRKGDEDQPTPRSRKSSGGNGSSKRNQESGRSTSASRKRKLHERSPNNDAVESVSGGGKSKSEHRNKSMWSVWYSSRRRRGLSQVAAIKLESILNSVWNMEESEFVKYPIAMSEYNKIVKHPMFLQTIAYKLRNRVYETIEQFVHDFRRVFYNSKMYNSEDSSYTRMTAALKNKFDLLLEDHFSGWDFTHITGSPSEQSTTPSLRYLAFANSGKNRRAKSSGKASPSSGANVTRAAEMSSSTSLER